MKSRYKISILAAALILGAISVGLNLEPVKAATRKIVYALRFTDGLIGYWSFNGADMSGVTAIDRSENGNNGTLTAGPTAVPGVVGQALNFDGVDDFVSIPDGTGYGDADALTMSAWFNTDTLITPSLGHSMIAVFADPTYLSLIGSGVSNPFVSMQVGGVQKTLSSLFAPEPHTWYQVVATYDGGTIRIYVDGVEKNSLGSLSGAVSIANNPKRIGNYVIAGAEFKGKIDEPRIYNRALSAAEIAYQFARTKPAGSGTAIKNITNKNDLSGYWNFDDCDTCTSVADRSGNGNEGTMYTTADSVVGDMHTTSGKFGNGATFNGSADIAMPNIRIDNRSFSVELWFNSTSFAGDRALFGQSTLAGCGTRLCLHLATRSSKLLFGFYADDLAGLTTLTTNTWYHAVFVYDNDAGQKYIYLNGVLDSSGASSPYLGTTGNTKIGKDCCDSNTLGFIDEVKMYDRALGGGEVKKLYDNGKNKFVVNMPQNNLLNDGLIGLWSFNGPDLSGVVSYDRSESGNNGTLINGVKTGPGIVGQALNLDGLNDYHGVAYTSALNYAGGDMTINFWVFLNTADTNSYIVSKPWNGGGQYNYYVAYNGTGLIFQIFGATGFAVYSNSAITKNQWNHVVATVDSSKSMKIYINGDLDNSDTHDIVSWTPSGGDLSHDLVIGSLYPYGDGWGGIPAFTVDGRMDEVRIYNRALSASEVKQLYNAGKR